jgi:hypothetical protein
VSPLDPETPPAGEDIHLPRPSLQPLLLTVGITAVVIGVTISIFLVIAGSLVSVAVIARWIADTRRDIAELPLEHHQ